MDTHSMHSVPDVTPDIDFEEHERTYRAFVRLARSVAVAIPLILAFISYWTR